jgi:hypothetical protein
MSFCRTKDTDGIAKSADTGVVILSLIYGSDTTQSPGLHAALIELSCASWKNYIVLQFIVFATCIEQICSSKRIYGFNICLFINF